MKALFFLAAASLCITATPCRAADNFEFEVTEPNFKVSIPSIPSMKMVVHPLHDSQPGLRYLGSDGTYNVSILTPTADAGMTALECASSIYKKLLSITDVRSQKSMERARIDDSTFIISYVTRVVDVPALHAHVVSAAGGSHCIEVHISRINPTVDELPVWYRRFGKTRIEAR